MKNQMLVEAKRLYDLGWCVHWLKPKSKAPIFSWKGSTPRMTWAMLENHYRQGMNLGVRLGAVSVLKNGRFLACIDGDAKTAKAHDEMMLFWAKWQADNWIEPGPVVKTGRGFGSFHLYVETKKPLGLVTLGKGDGWEVVAYSKGRQMVLPPSVHPSGAVYKWQGISHQATLPLAWWDDKDARDAGIGTGIKVAETFLKVDLDSTRLTEKSKSLILDGAPQGARSEALFGLAREMRAIGMKSEEIVSVLTEPEYGISEAARERRGESRVAQADWVRRYAVNAAESKAGAKAAFPDDIGWEHWTPGAKWQDQLAINKDNGKPYSTLQNVTLILDNDHRIGMKLIKRNSFSYRDTYTRDTPWGGRKGEILSDDDVAKITLWVGESYKFEPAREKLNNALTVLACRNSFDPVRDMLEALPEWDGVGRLDGWLKRYFGARGNEEYLAQVFRKWFVAMVMRVYEPGAMFQWMPIFEGAQGIGKSTFGRILVGEEYFLDWLPNLHDKDAALALQGIWCVELGELASLRKNELDVVKSFLTRSLDKVRPPFGRRTIESARRCVFFGTTNRVKYLLDETGNRRFKPVEVGQLNFKALRRDRVQLFAEAIMIYKLGLEDVVSLNNMEGEAKEFEQNIQKEKMVSDDSELMRDILFTYFSEQQKLQKSEQKIDLNRVKISTLFGVGTMDTFIDPPLLKWRFETKNAMLAAKALKNLGAEKVKEMGGNVWKIPKMET